MTTTNCAPMLRLKNGKTVCEYDLSDSVFEIPASTFVDKVEQSQYVLKRLDFKTARRSSNAFSAGEVILRKLVVRKTTGDDGKMVTNLNVGPNLRPINYYILICVYDSEKEQYVPYMVNGNPIRISIKDALGNFVPIPDTMGSHFSAKIIAEGNPSKARKIKLNIKITVEVMGLKKFEKVRGQSLSAGERVVLINGRN